MEHRMNRSVERRRFPVGGTVPGTVVVAPFEHPERGQVRCSATPLVAASLRRLGHHVQERRVGVGAANGTLFTASYLDAQGRAVGIAAAAHDSDAAGLIAARESVEAWSALWRTRRLLVADVGDRSPCRHVDIADETMRRFVERGDQVVVIGGRDGVLPALCGQGSMPPGAVLVESVQDVPAVHVDPERVSYLVAAGTDVDGAMRVVSALRARYPRIRGPHPDGFCYEQSDRIETVRMVSGSCDHVLVVGAVNALDSVALVAVTGERGTPVHLVDDVSRILPHWLAGAAAVGVVTTSSAPRGLAAEVVDVLSGLGPCSIVRKRVVTEVLRAAPWPRDHGPVDVRGPREACTPYATSSG